MYVWNPISNIIIVLEIRDLNMVVVTMASDHANARSKVPMVIEEIVPLLELI
jgi:hypothetical protein